MLMTMLKKDVLLPISPSFYKRYVDDIISRRKKDEPDLLLEKLMNYHKNINFTVERNPSKFLDTELLINNGFCETRVFRKPNKFPLHWFSKTPVRYKRNAITGDLHRAKKISSNYFEEVEKIHKKFINAGFPERFVSSVIDKFNNPIPIEEDDDVLIPPYFFDDPIPFILVKIPFCPENEHLPKHFIRKLKSFLEMCNICVIYEGSCSCSDTYIGETKRNVEVRWLEHEHLKGKSEPAKHLNKNPTHKFSWRVLMSAPQNTRIRKKS